MKNNATLLRGDELAVLEAGFAEGFVSNPIKAGYNNKSVNVSRQQGRNKNRGSYPGAAAHRKLNAPHVKAAVGPVLAGKPSVVELMTFRRKLADG